MDPVNVTITDPFELAGYQRARCHRLVADVHNLSDECDLDLIVDGMDSELMPVLIARLEAALVALEAIHGV